MPITAPGLLLVRIIYYGGAACAKWADNSIGIFLYYTGTIAIKLTNDAGVSVEDHSL